MANRGTWAHRQASTDGVRWRRLTQTTNGLRGRGRHTCSAPSLAISRLQHRGWTGLCRNCGVSSVGWLPLAVFVGAVRLHGGIAQADVGESVFSTWAIAHGNLACAYPSAPHLTLIPPLWPLLSSALAALFHIGDSLPFPSHAALGPHCSHGPVLF